MKWNLPQIQIHVYLAPSGHPDPHLCCLTSQTPVSHKLTIFFLIGCFIAIIELHNSTREIQIHTLLTENLKTAVAGL